MKNKHSKNSRTLSIYIRLCAGKLINKAEEANRFGVDERSIQRDIDDIRAFLEDQKTERSTESREIIYDRVHKGFTMTGTDGSAMTNSEILAVSKILLESRAFSKTTIGNYLISDKDILKIPVKKFSKCHHPTYDSFRDMSWPIFLLEYNLIPEKLKEKEYISLLFQGCEKLDTSTEEIEMKAAWKQEIQEGRYPEIGGIFFDRKKLEQKVLSDDQPKILDGDLFEFVKKQLAECDKRRINRTPYSLERLQDPNQGHWELWPDPSSKNLRNQGKNPKKQKNSGYIQFNCPQGMFARNPVEDIVEDGVVGIDFGTKSTIVVRLDEHSQIRQMRVGRGDLSKGIRQGDFENPTIMEFTDIPSFLKRYREKEGRPDTRWNDVAISHEAKNDFFADTDSDNYYAFFSDLKQWCADDTRQIMLRDKCGNERILPDFLEINDTMFNPIELYA